MLISQFLRISYSTNTRISGDDMIGTLIDSVSEIVAERIYEKLEEKLQQSQRIQKVSQSSALVSSGDDDDQLITKAEACHFLDRCDSTLSKWAQAPDHDHNKPESETDHGPLW